jgi:hypothetical protein
VRREEMIEEEAAYRDEAGEERKGGAAERKP